MALGTHLVSNKCIAHWALQAQRPPVPPLLHPFPASPGPRAGPTPHPGPRAWARPELPAVGSSAGSSISAPSSPGGACPGGGRPAGRGGTADAAAAPAAAPGRGPGGRAAAAAAQRAGRRAGAAGTRAERGHQEQGQGQGGRQGEQEPLSPETPRAGGLGVGRTAGRCEQGSRPGAGPPGGHLLPAEGAASLRARRGFPHRPGRWLGPYSSSERDTGSPEPAGWSVANTGPRPWRRGACGVGRDVRLSSAGTPVCLHRQQAGPQADSGDKPQGQRRH